MSSSTIRSMLGFLGVLAVLVGLAGAAQAVQPDPPGKQAGKFVVSETGDVFDTTTSLRWQQNPGAAGTAVSKCDSGAPCVWQDAVDYCDALGGGSRLAEVKELISLLDYSQSNPALPDGHPFSGVQSAFYWSAATNVGNPTYAWFVHLFNGLVFNGSKGSDIGHAWCVR
jgi:hypothetical protein